MKNGQIAFGRKSIECNYNLLVGQQSRQWHKQKSADVIDRTDQRQFVLVLVTKNAKLQLNKFK